MQKVGVVSLPLPIQSLVESTHTTCDTCDERRSNKNDSSPEKLSEAKEQPRKNIYGHTDYSQDIGIDMAIGKPAHHRIDDPLRPAANSTQKHFPLEFPFTPLCPKATRFVSTIQVSSNGRV